MHYFTIRHLLQPKLGSALQFTENRAKTLTYNADNKDKGTAA